MIVLNVGDTIAAGASVASKLTSTISGMTLSAGVETYDILDQRQLANSPATIYTTPSSTQAFILSIHVVNTDTVARTFQFFVNGTAAGNAITPAITLRPGGFALYTEMGGWAIMNGSSIAFDGISGSLVKVTYLGGSQTAFTPTRGTKVMYVEAVGAGGGGGGVLDAATNAAAGGGGGSGAYSAVLTTVIASVAVSVGVGGAGGAAGANNGAVGGDTTFGSILTAKGGSGGISDTVTTLHIGGLGGAGGLASGGVGDIKEDGRAGERGITLAAAQAVSGNGGNSYFGAGAQGAKAQANGANAVGGGGGGAGGLNLSSVASQAGGNGANGLIRIWEFA